MGPAVRAADGRIFTGVNVHHFTGGPCAELGALGAARAGGATELSHVVAAGNHGRGAKSLCGRGRQILADHHPHARVILPGPTGSSASPRPTCCHWPSTTVRSSPDDAFVEGSLSGRV